MQKELHTDYRGRINDTLMLYLAVLSYIFDLSHNLSSHCVRYTAPLFYFVSVQPALLFLKSWSSSFHHRIISLMWSWRSFFLPHVRTKPWQHTSWGQAITRTDAASDDLPGSWVTSLLRNKHLTQVGTNLAYSWNHASVLSTSKLVLLCLSYSCWLSARTTVKPTNTTIKKQVWLKIFQLLPTCVGAASEPTQLRPVRTSYKVVDLWITLTNRQSQDHTQCCICWKFTMKSHWNSPMKKCERAVQGKNAFALPLRSLSQTKPVSSVLRVNLSRFMNDTHFRVYSPRRGSICCH